MKAPTQLEVAVAAYETAQRTTLQSHWEAARQEIEKTPATYPHVNVNLKEMLFDCLLHLGRFGECRSAARQALPRASYPPNLFGTCWVAIIAATYFADGEAAALIEFKDLAISLLENNLPGLFPRLPFLKRRAGDETLPSWLRLFCDDAKVTNLQIGAGHTTDHVDVAHVFGQIVELAKAQPGIFNDPRFCLLVPLMDGQSITWRDAGGKILVPMAGANTRVVGVHVPIYPNGNHPNAINPNRYPHAAPVTKLYGSDFLASVRSQWLTDARVIECHANDWVGRTEILRLWVVEKGRKNPSSRGPVLLRLFSPSRIQHYLYRRYRRRPAAAASIPAMLREANTTVVPACVACDSVLLSPSASASHKHEWLLHTCPYCGKDLKAYWRGAKAYQVQIAHVDDVDKRGQFTVGRFIPVSDGGLVKHVQSWYTDMPLLAAELVRPLDPLGFGPVDVVIHSQPGGQARVTCEPSRGTTPAPAPRPRPPAALSQAVLPFRDWNPGVAVPRSIMRNIGTPEARASAGAAEVGSITAEWAMKKQAKLDRNARIEAFPGAILKFWASNGFTVGDVTRDERRKKLGISVDGIFFKALEPDDRGKRKLALVNYASAEVERFTFLPRESTLFTGFIERELANLDAGISFRVVEKAIISRYYPSHRTQYLIPVTDAKLSMKRRRKVLACESCGTMYLKHVGRRASVIDQLASPTCPYCKVQTRLVERCPAVVHLGFEPAPAQNQPGTPFAPRYHYRRSRTIGANYHGVHVDIPLNPRTRHVLYMGLQDQFKNRLIGPLKLDLVYGLMKAEVPAFCGSRVVAFKPGTAVHEIEWRPAYELPEDRLAI